MSSSLKYSENQGTKGPNLPLFQDSELLFSEQDIDYIAQRSASPYFFPKSTADLPYSN